MAFFVTTLYSAFLGMMIRNLTIVGINAPDHKVTVSNLICRSNAFRTLSLLSLFVVDWICFVIMFPPAETFSFQTSDVILLIMYSPSLITLGMGVVLSLEDSTQYCPPVSAYHFICIVAEATWVITKLSRLTDPIPANQFAYLFLVLIVYAILRLGLSLLYVLISRRRVGSLEPSLLSVAGILLKPALFVVLGSLIQNGVVPSIIRG